MAEQKNNDYTEDTSEDGYSHLQYRELRRVRRELRRQRKDQRPPMRYLFWGLMFILWGIIVALLRQNIISADNIWKVFITGLGSIFLIQALIYYLTPEYRSHAVGRVTPGAILLLIGLSFLVGLNAWWPVILVAAGVAIIFITWFLQREIERRRVTQETLRESEVKYQHIIDNANSAIVEMDPNGKISFMNKFALNFFGFPEAEILGQNVVGTIIAPEAAAATNWKDMINKIVTSPDASQHNEMENQRKGGDKVWMAWTYKPIMDDSNNLKEILCAGIDRTQQKKVEEQAAQEIKEKTAVEERTRLARDLHDAVSQTLFSTSLIAEVLPKVWERNKDDGIKKLEEVRQLTRGALAEMRTLLFELRPAALTDADMNELLRQLAESVTGRARVPVTLEVNGTCEVSPDVKIALYRIAQEALNNIAKHSGASKARVSLVCQPHRVVLEIADNGHGFDVSQAPQGSFGLSNIKERAGQIGASLKIESNINEGTVITVDWHDAVEVSK